MIFAVTGKNTAAPNAPLVFRGEYGQMIRQAAEIGYNAMELHIDDSDALDRNGLKKLLARHRMTLSSIGTGSAYADAHLSLSSEDPAVRGRAVERMRAHIRTAGDYGAVVIVGLIKGLVKECPGRETYLANLRGSLSELLKTAEQYRVALVLEILNRYESDFLNTIDEGLEFLRTFDSDYLKLHLDTYHMNIEERDIGESIRRAKGKIGHVHLADSDRWYAGHGHYDFRQTFRALREVGYSGAFSVESFQFPDSVTSASNTYRYVTKLLREL